MLGQAERQTLWSNNFHPKKEHRWWQDMTLAEMVEKTQESEKQAHF